MLMRKNNKNGVRSTAVFLVMFLFSLTSVVTSRAHSSFSTSFETALSPFNTNGKTYFLHDKDTARRPLEGNLARELALLSTTYGIDESWKLVPRGGWLIPAGYNPFGYQITELGQKFLEFDGSLDSDIGRFLASVKSRKRFEAIKSQWLEILRVSKKGQSMRIYKSLEELISFCLKAGFLD